MKILLKIAVVVSYWLRKPTVLNYSVIETCNAKCTMCDLWKSNDGFSIFKDDIENFSEVLKKTTNHVGISGGEPFLRDDLDELIHSFIKNFKRLKSISITSHGFQFERIKKIVPAVAEDLRSNQIDFGINFSMDGNEDAHDRQRGVPGGFEKLLKSIHFCKKMGLRVNLQFTATNLNVYTAPYVLHFAQSNGINASFRVATNITRLGKSDQPICALEADQRSFFADFLLSEKLMKTSSRSKKIYYRKLAKFLLKSKYFGERNCLFKRSGVYLDGNGQAYPCSLFKGSGVAVEDLTTANLKKMQRDLKSSCDTCIHDQSMIPSLADGVFEFYNMLLPQQLTRRITFILKLGSAYLHRHPLPTQSIEQKREKILIIGQYGGEHVGDSAILGGVISQYSSAQLTVASIRADRTEFWIAGLPTYYRQNVDTLTIFEALRRAKTYDKIIFGGGPIMWLPTIILSHYLILRSARCDAVVEVKGCGIVESGNRFYLTFLNYVFKRSAVLEFRSKQSVQFCEQNNLVGAVCIEDPAISFLKGELN